MGRSARGAVAALVVVVAATAGCTRPAERSEPEGRPAAGPGGETAARNEPVAPAQPSPDAGGVASPAAQTSGAASPASSVATAGAPVPAPGAGAPSEGHPPPAQATQGPEPLPPTPPAPARADRLPTVPAPGSLAPPAGLVAVASSESEVELRWEGATGAGEPVSFEILRDDAVVATATEPTARHGGLAPAERACYSIRAVDRAGRRSRPSAPVCLTTPDRTPPEAPTAVVAEAASDREIMLRWTAARDRVGVVRYEVRDGDAVVATAETTAARVAGLSPWREVCYAVVALDAAGNRSAPSERACARTLDVTPPTPPANPAAVATAETQVELSWGESTDDAGVKGYRVLRGDAVVATTGKLAARENRLRASTEYCYTVVAFDAAGNVSVPAGPVCATTPDLTPPSQPGAVTVAALAEDRVEIRWDAATDNVGVATYEVRRAGEVRLREAGLRGEEAGLRAYTNYCYSVVALDAAGNRSSPTISECARTLDVTPPSTPRELALRPSAHQQLEARWGASSDNAKVAGYELLRDGQVVAAASGPAVDVFGLADGTEYCFTVRAYDPAGNRSPEASLACGKTLAPEQPVPPRNVAVQRRPKAVQLRWEAPGRPDVVFRVYEDRRPIGSTRFLTYSVHRNDGKRRCYSVGAVDEAGRESPRSEEACVAFLAETSSAR